MGTNCSRKRWTGWELNPRPQPAWLINYLKSGAANRGPYCSNPPGPLCLDCIVFGKQNIHYLFSRYSLFSFFLDSKHNSKLVSSCLFPMKNQMQYKFEHFNSVTISIPKFFPITNVGISNVLGGI